MPTPIIASARNPKIKLVRALTGRARERRSAESFLAEGVRLVEEACAADWPFHFVLYSDDLSPRGRELIGKLADRQIQVEQVEGALLQSLSDTEISQGIVAVLGQARLPLPEAANFLLVPDSIRDPGNLGSLLRAAEAAGVQAVLVPPETTDAFAPKVVRAGMGAHFRLPIQTLGWEDIHERMKGLRVFLADMQGRSCWQTDLRPPLALIVGGEAEGASSRAHQLADALVRIPMGGKTESLNAAVAGSVLMFEVMRQRNTKQ
jgi:TrmH family RNA methyltransferase